MIEVKPALGVKPDHDLRRSFHLQFPHLRGSWSKFSDCDQAQDFVTKLGVSFKREITPGKEPAVTIGLNKVAGSGVAIQKT